MSHPQRADPGCRHSRNQCRHARERPVSSWLLALQMPEKFGYALPLLEVSAMSLVKKDYRLVPQERQVRIADEKCRASISIGIFVVDIVVPAVVATVATMAMACR